MKALLTAIFTLLFINITFWTYAQTSISGVVNTPVVLSKNSSPYLVEEDLVIYPDGEITIEPGV